MHPKLSYYTYHLWETLLTFRYLISNVFAVVLLSYGGLDTKNNTTYIITVIIIVSTVKKNSARKRSVRTYREHINIQNVSLAA